MRRQQRVTVCGVSVPAQRHGMASSTWWEISSTSAIKIMTTIFGNRPLPSPGHGTLLPESSRNGYRGQWKMSNNDGKYELMFNYNF